MGRNRDTAKKAGTSFETLITVYLATHVDDRIERRRQTGAKDRGDISGLRAWGQRLVGECKNYGGTLHPGPWLNEAEVEAGNDDAAAGIVFAKRRGTQAAGDQFVLMTVDTLCFLLTGINPATSGGEDEEGK